jgi:nucleoside-diphosphate-sugar epimerase
MKVFLTGGTGFTGSYVIPLLIQNGFQVRCLYRPTRDRSALPHQPDVEWVPGDVSDAESLSASMKWTDALVNIVSLGSSHADTIIRAAQIAGIQRAIFISTTAIFTQLNAESKKVRLEAEHAIQTSRLCCTILRPTMIYGGRRDRNMWRLIRFMRYSPIVPVFGSGNHLQQPIHVNDVARAVVDCLKSDWTVGKCYNIAGEHALTYNQVIDTIAHGMKKKVWKLHIPSRIAVALPRFFEQLRIPFPIKAEQILRLNENKDFSYEEAAKDFGFSPLSFEQGIGMELQQVGNR